MIKNDSYLTNEIVKEKYEEIMNTGLPFLQIFPQLFQERNLAKTFKLKKTQRNKSLTSYDLNANDDNIGEFREQLFLHCGMNLNIFKLPI
jgi:hypothetical protein